MTRIWISPRLISSVSAGRPYRPCFSFPAGPPRKTITTRRPVRTLPRLQILTCRGPWPLRKVCLCPARIVTAPPPKLSLSHRVLLSRNCFRGIILIRLRKHCGFPLDSPLFLFQTPTPRAVQGSNCVCDKTNTPVASHSRDREICCATAICPSTTHQRFAQKAPSLLQRPNLPSNTN